MVEANQHVAFIIPMSLARRLDARIETERGNQPVGTVNRSSLIRAAVTAFLEGTPDPSAPVPKLRKNASARQSRDEQVSFKPYRPPMVEKPPVRTRQRPAPQPVPAAE